MLWCTHDLKGLVLAATLTNVKDILHQWCVVHQVCNKHLIGYILPASSAYTDMSYMT